MIPTAKNSRRRGAVVALLIAIAGALGIGLIATPASADEVGTEYEWKINGNVRNQGEPLADVRIVVSGNGFESSIITDETGRFQIGVPDEGPWTVTMDVASLPADIELGETVTEKTAEFGRTKFVTTNFSIGERAVNQASFVDQLIARVIYGINFGLMLGLASVGLSLVFGTTGLSNFAHAEMVTFGAIAALFFGLVLQLPMFIAIPLAVAASAAAGWGMDSALWRPLRRRSLGLVQLMIVSIGLSLLLRYLFQVFVGGETIQLPGFDDPKIQLFGVTALSITDFVSMGLSLAVIIGFAAWLLLSKVGKATRAISDNADLAAASGIDVERIVRVVWVLAAAMAGLAGVLWAYFRPGIKWDMGAQILLLIFAAVTLGGLGTAFGALLGSLVVGLLVETSSLFIPSDLKYVGALVILIVILLIRPQGILGTKQRIG